MSLDKKRKASIVFALVGALIIGGVAMDKKEASAAEQVQINMEKIDKSIQREIREHTDLSFSSNPYDYIQDSEYYDNVIELGVAALPELENMLKTSENNGLNEYIVAIAIEEISHADVNSILENPDGCGWENAKEFSGEWAAIKAEANIRVEKIIQSNALGDKEKVALISDYGVLAVPTIEQYISNKKIGRSGNGLKDELTQVMNSYGLSTEEVSMLSDYIEAK